MSLRGFKRPSAPPSRAKLSWNAVRSCRHYASWEPNFDDFKNKEFPLLVDCLTWKPTHLLNAALAGFLPPNFPHVFPTPTALAPGYHFVYSPPAIKTSSLLEDGTDSEHCPHPSYKFRLWAGGDIHFNNHSKLPPLLHTGNQAVIAERIVDIKTKAEGKRAFVKLRRIVAQKIGDALISSSDRLELLSFSPENIESPLHLRTTDIVPVLIEDRWLVFTKDPPGGLMQDVESKIPVCPKNGDFSWTLRPTHALLFRFSALTYNAHAIHLDPEYTRNVYELPDLVVQGPLTAFLMLQILTHGLRLYETKRGMIRGQLAISSMTYTNMAALYVGHVMEVSCKRMEGDDHVQGNQVWNVWISKKVDRTWRIAVKATARIHVRPVEKARAFQGYRGLGEVQAADGNEDHADTHVGKGVETREAPEASRVRAGNADSENGLQRKPDSS